MDGVLPTIQSGQPVKEQVEGLLAFANSLHHQRRADAKFRARQWVDAKAAKKNLAPAPVNPRRSPRQSIQSPHLEAVSRDVPRGLEDDESRRSRIDSGEGSSDEEPDVIRKKGTARNLPKLSPSLRAAKMQLAEDLKNDEDLSASEAQALVEKYRQRNRAADGAVQASVERFHRGRKLQEPLLDDLKTLKKVIADKNRHVHLLEGLGIRSTYIKNYKATQWEDGNTRGSSRSSARTPDRQPVSKKSGDERGGSFSFTRSKDVDAWSLRTNSKDSTGRRQADSPEMSLEEEEERLMAMAQELESKEKAQSLRLQRSPESLRPRGFERNDDWLHGLHRAVQKKPTAAQELTLQLQVPRHRLQRAPRCLQPLSDKDLAARRIGNVAFWHSSAWPTSLRKVAKVAKEAPSPMQETLDLSPKHPFVIGEPKQEISEVATLRLEEEASSTSSSSSSSSVSPKQKLAKSCLKPWRSPVEAYLGKSFIFPQRRGSAARASELLFGGLQKSAALEAKVITPEETETVLGAATSRAAWEKIKRTNGFAALCHIRNDR